MVVQRENNDESGMFFLEKTQILRLEQILIDLKNERSYRIFGYILIPIVLGFLILKKSNEKISILMKKKKELMPKVIIDIETSNDQIKSITRNLIETDTYLVYSVRTDILNKLEEYTVILQHLKQRNANFEKSFNDIIENSIQIIIESKITIENFNKELVERRKKEYEFLFRRSSVDLNDEQKNAIVTDDKHNIVVAGAGSGKTEVLITRIAYLVLRKQETIPPSRILVLAFQNKAAKEIEDRLDKKFGIKVKIKTFHSLGLEVLINASLNPKIKFNGNNFQFAFYHFIAELYEKAENESSFQDKIVAYMMNFGEVERIWKTRKESIESIPKDVATFIIKAKTNGLTPQNILERLDKEKWSAKQRAFAELALIIYKEYEKELQLRKEIDFSDMINQAVLELNKTKSLYENSFDHILVDEYQDISRQRYLLIKSLMAKNRDSKLFCVGDDWQSIMGFTGSNLEFFLKFQKYFDHPERTDLSINYRCNKSIVDAGADLIKLNKEAQLEKRTTANNNEEKKIIVFSSLKENIWDYYQQVAIHSVNMAKEYLNKGYEPHDLMILYRITKPYLLNHIFEYAKFNNVVIQKNSRDPKSISLMTVHKSKGLQAKVVFILCVDKGLYGFPSEIEDPFIFEPAMDRKLNNKEEEERRLFYVAITRSKEDVIIYTQKNNESMFLKEIINHTEVKDLNFVNIMKGEHT